MLLTRITLISIIEFKLEYNCSVGDCDWRFLENWHIVKSFSHCFGLRRSSFYHQRVLLDNWTNHYLLYLIIYCVYFECEEKYYLQIEKHHLSCRRLKMMWISELRWCSIYWSQCWPRSELSKVNAFTVFISRITFEIWYGFYIVLW